MRAMLGTSVAALVGSAASLDPLAVGCGAGAVAAAVGLGVAFPSLGVFGAVQARADGDPGTLALTFDDGPHPRHTPQVLEALAAGGHRATFFLVGRTLALHPAVGRAERCQHVPLLDLQNVAAHQVDIRQAESVQAPGQPDA